MKVSADFKVRGGIHTIASREHTAKKAGKKRR
jgi:hypothetical protein